MLAIREINLGTYAFEAGELWTALDEVGEERGERYLTGVFPLLRRQGQERRHPPDARRDERRGVNDRVGLMDADRLAQRRILERHARAGVTFLAPDSIRVDAGVEIGEDTTVGPGVDAARSDDGGRPEARSARRPRSPTARLARA